MKRYRQTLRVHLRRCRPIGRRRHRLLWTRPSRTLRPRNLDLERALRPRARRQPVKEVAKKNEAITGIIEEVYYDLVLIMGCGELKHLHKVT